MDKDEDTQKTQEAPQASQKPGEGATPNADSQDGQLGAGGMRALEAERETNKILRSKLAHLEKKISSLNGLDPKELQSQLEEAQKELALSRQKEQINTWRAETAKKYGLPLEVLRGSNQEEIEEHAKAIKELLPDPPSVPVVPTVGSVPAGGGVSEQEKFVQLLFGRY